MSTGSLDAAPARFLSRNAVKYILAPLDDAEVRKTAVVRWRREYLDKYRGWFKEPPTRLEDFSVDSAIDGIARSYRRFTLFYLPASGDSPRRALVLLNQVAKLARSCSRPRTREENAARKFDLRKALKNVASDRAAQEYLADELHWSLRLGVRPRATHEYLLHVLAHLLLGQPPEGSAIPAPRPKALQALEQLAREAVSSLLYDYGDHERFDLAPEGLAALEILHDAVARGEPAAVATLAREASEVVVPNLPSLPRGNQPDEGARRAIVALADFFHTVVGAAYLSYSVNDDGDARMSIFADLLHRFFAACHERDSRLAIPLPSFVNETLAAWRPEAGRPVRRPKGA